MPNSPTHPELSDALNRLWSQFLPQMEERVKAIESANQALAAGRLGAEERARANAAAHKLAGVLGTFGLTKGTVLAREAEMLFVSESGIDATTLPRLKEIVRQLREMIAHRTHAPAVEQGSGSN